MAPFHPIGTQWPQNFNIQTKSDGLSLFLINKSFFQLKLYIKWLFKNINRNKRKNMNNINENYINWRFNLSEKSENLVKSQEN